MLRCREPGSYVAVWEKRAPLTTLPHGSRLGALKRTDIHIEAAFNAKARCLLLKRLIAAAPLHIAGGTVLDRPSWELKPGNRAAQPRFF